MRISFLIQSNLVRKSLINLALYNNAQGRNGFSGLCTKCPGYNNNLVITTHFSGTKGVVVNNLH